MKKLFFGAAAFCLSGCATIDDMNRSFENSLSPPAPTIEPFSTAQHYDAYKAEVWPHVVRWFAEHGQQLSTIDQASGLASATFVWSDPQAYCGTDFRDRILTRTGQVSIMVTPEGLRTKVEIFARYSTLSNNAIAGVVTFNCQSTGELERALFEYLDRNVAQPKSGQ